MSRLRRSLKILRVFWRHRLHELLASERVTGAFGSFVRVLPHRRARPGDGSLACRLRLALEDLGPIFVKFGQLLSTRRDLLSEDVANELSLLQDQVPPFPAVEARVIIERALGKPIESLFASFDDVPLASASVAQVHAATLAGGQKVVIKVIRPRIERTIREDIGLLYTLAGWIERFHPDGWRLRPREVVRDYQHVVLDELDLQREAANTAQLRRNFLDSELLYVPEVYWDYSRREVCVMERIHGIPISDVARLRAHGTDLKELAERGVKIFFTQVFRDSFFHADMHPGNIFIDVTDPAKPRYIGIDCAIMGSLSDSDQYYLARNLLAMFQRRYREVAELHIECGWVPPQTRVHEFESAIRSACEPIFEKPLGQISFGQLVVYLFQTARRFDMEVQPSLVLLEKTLLHIEGLGRQLYPELDLWATAKPFLEQWVADRYSPRALIEKLQRSAPAWIEQLPQRPELLRERLESLLHGAPARHQPSASAPPRGGVRWRAWELAIAVIGMILVNRQAGADPLAWHPATWVFAALAAHALLARRALD